jgi:hypothetical protein
MPDIDLAHLEKAARWGPPVPVAPPGPAAPADGGGVAGDVLVVGTDDWAIGEAVSKLVAAGRRAHQCSDSVEAPFPCHALVTGRGCPLDRYPVAAVLDVHSRPRARLPLSEMGAVCGLRAGLALVVGGLAGESILSPWAHHVPVDGDIVSACDRAVAEGRNPNAERKA